MRQYGRCHSLWRTRHPGELKDMVCSPAGTTIEAVAKMEEMGLRSAIIEGMRACANRGKEMSKK